MGIGIGHGNQTRFQCGLYIIFRNVTRDFKPSFSISSTADMGVSFYHGHQRFDLIADMALMIARIPCKFGDSLFITPSMNRINLLDFPSDIESPIA